MAVGYRVGEPEETNAKKLIEFEIVESGNEPMLDYLAAALHCEPTLESIKTAIDRQFGADAIGMWLTDDPEWAVERYGPGEAYSVEIPSDAIIGTDLGPDGKLWIWRKKPLISKEEGEGYMWTQKGRETPTPGPTVFVEIRMLKDAPAIIGSDMNVYGPFTAGKVYAIPKENARIFIKTKVAVATRKEAEKPTLKEMFKGEVLTPYIEAARVRPLVPEEKPKLDTAMVADYFLMNLKDAGVPLPSRFKSEFEKALDPSKTIEENMEIMDKLIEDIVRREKPSPAEKRRQALLRESEELLGEIQEERRRG